MTLNNQKLNIAVASQVSGESYNFPLACRDSIQKLGLTF